MPVSYNEAEKLPYGVYKVLVWTRLIEFWMDYKNHNPDRIAYCDERVIACQKQLDYWKSKNAQNS